MGKPGRSHARGLVCTLVVVLLLGSSFLVVPPAAAGPGDLVAPVYADGDWWNHTWSGDHQVPAQAGDYDLMFSDVNGWLKLTVDGTTSYLGTVAWVMKVSGKVQFSGGWTSDTEEGSTTMDARVVGTEWRSAIDLSLLGSTLSYTGQVEIATKSGPEDFDMVIWENRTLDRPMRIMLLPVPIATFPKEDQTVTVRYTFESGSFATQRIERWSYTSSYKGLTDVQGTDITFSDQHTFTMVGNVTVGETRTPVERSVYFETTPRKGITIDQFLGLEIRTYQVAAVTNHPDLVVADGEFNVSDYSPTEGQEINFTAQIHNLGITEVRAVVVELWASLDDERPVRQNSTTIASILANDQVGVYFNWTGEEVGQWEFFLRVDPTNVVTESRENNNEASILLIVSYDVPKPNLFVVEDGITFEPPSPVPNRTAIQITAEVGNEGPGVAYNVTVDFYVGQPGSGGVQIGWRETIDEIAAGKSKSTFINWGADIAGYLSIWIHLDANNSVNESVETDNLASAPLTVISQPKGEVDLVVAAIKMVDSNGLAIQPFPKGETITVKVTVSNIESNPAKRVHMSVYVDTEDPAGLVGAQEGAIDGKSLVTWQVPWTVDREDGNHQLRVTVVALGDVDSTYKDNVGIENFTVGPRSYPEPEPLDVTIFPDSTLVKPGSVISVSGKVTLAKNGFEVPGATVYVQIRGQNNPVEVVTNSLGRYLANITVPNKDGNYRLEAQVRQGLSEGDNAITITVEKDSAIGGNGGGDDDGMSLSFFVISMVIVLAVLMPLTYYILVSRAEIKRRVRHVHEEIVEIVDTEKK